MKEVSNKATERSVMSASAEAADLLRQIAGKGEPGETKKAAWLRAFRKLRGDWTFNRVKDLWRQEPRARVSAEELTQLRTVAKQSTGGGDDILARTADALENVAARLDRLDSDFFGPDVSSLRDLADRMRS